MCFWKSKQSKILVAKRNIVVYKIGESADENTFIPYYVNSFTYKTDERCLVYPDFKNHGITIGFHGYINILVSKSFNPPMITVHKNTKWKLQITTYITYDMPLYLGKFIVPKGATYCVNKLNEIVSSQIIYTGQHINVLEALGTNLKELWKEE